MKKAAFSAAFHASDTEAMLKRYLTQITSRLERSTRTGR